MVHCCLLQVITFSLCKYMIYYHLDISYIIYKDWGSLWTLKRSPWRPNSCGSLKDREASMTLLRTFQDRARTTPGKERLPVMWLKDTAQGPRNGRKHHLLILHLQWLCPLHHIMPENVEGSFYWKSESIFRLLPAFVFSFLLHHGCLTEQQGKETHFQ